MKEGSAMEVDVAYASGLSEMETELELASEETKNVILELSSQTNLQLTWYKYYAGMEHYRFFFQVGYSFSLTDRSYSVT